jgi:septal ring factor EnvC (AmiA/AmiB activator)
MRFGFIGLLFFMGGIFSISTANNQRNQLLQELATIETHYGKIAKSLKLLTEEIHQKRRRLTEINQEIKSKKQKLSVYHREFNGQIKATYLIGRQEKLKLLLNQQDPVLASRMMMYYHYLNQARLKKLIAIEYHLSTLSTLKDQSRQETAQLKKTARLKKIALKKWATTKYKRKQLLSKLNKNIRLNTQRKTLLKQQDTQLKDLISSLDKKVSRNNSLNKNPQEIELIQQGVAKNLAPSAQQEPQKRAYLTGVVPFKRLKGKLPWPLKGKFRQLFASKRPEGRWDGVLISANEGTNIKAISHGRVIYADWLRGYGLLVIIDHGKGYMSLYAFNQSLNKKMGDQVTEGTVIATVGKSGGRHQAGLYFGIRYQGKAVNPTHWCRKISNAQID